MSVETDSVAFHPPVDTFEAVSVGKKWFVDFFFKGLIAHQIRFSRQCVYEKDGVFIYLTNNSGPTDTQLPGRLQIYERDGRAFVRWLPLKSVDYTGDDDEQGWEVINQTPGSCLVFCYRERLYHVFFTVASK